MNKTSMYVGVQSAILSVKPDPAAKLQLVVNQHMQCALLLGNRYQTSQQLGSAFHPTHGFTSTRSYHKAAVSMLSQKPVPTNAYGHSCC